MSRLCHLGLKTKDNCRKSSVLTCVTLFAQDNNASNQYQARAQTPEMLSYWSRRVVFLYLLRPWRLPRLIIDSLSRPAYIWDHKRITAAQFTLLLAWFGLNVAFLTVRWEFPREKRAALAAAINLTPVILGGRTCLVADAIGISLQSYYLLHHWLARLSFVEMGLHAIIHTKQQKTWTASSAMGLTAMILCVIITASSTRFTRNRSIAFAWSHRALATAMLCALLAHLWLMRFRDGLVAKLLISGVVFIWPLSLLRRWRRRREARATIHKLWVGGFNNENSQYTRAALLKIPLARDILVYPGAYFYVMFDRQPFWRRYHGPPMMVYDWKTPPEPLAWNESKLSTSELTFLVEDRPSVSSTLSQLEASVTLDGPYGQNPNLESFDSVILIAQGIGIAGIMPLAFAIAERRNYDRIKKEEMRSEDSTPELNARLHLDRTRRLTLIWTMEDNNQLEWAVEQIDRLFDLDPKSGLLHAWIYEPDKPDDSKIQDPRTPLKAAQAFKDHCRLVHVPKARRNAALEQQTDSLLMTSPGDVAIAVCGTADFRQTVRDITWVYPRQARFFELEHQPHSTSANRENSSPTRPHSEGLRSFASSLEDEVRLSRLPRKEVRQQRVQVQHVHIHQETSLAGSIRMS
ncbi:hypothetical protein B0T10DRAFT_463626 [Thelonectria olida]|uniref:FAD-binding FR-type domain-containing protein n=1 Tax=Thelonectria olida TaxID=1576542 RepID=A0A9P8VZU9_9HYPO|nr:hypothetical protein B0T10DRAFT_463626 [Thelonectria olida]